MLSFLIKLVVYLSPIFANYICGGMFFITAYRFAHEGECKVQLMAGL